MNIMEQTPAAIQIRTNGMTWEQAREMIEERFGALMWDHRWTAYPADGVTVQMVFAEPAADVSRRAMSNASQPQAPEHTDDLAVDRFASAMKEKLAAARAKGRGGWDDPECSQERLSSMLREHVMKGDPRDVANFCMFLWCRGEAIAPYSASTRDGENYAAGFLKAKGYFPSLVQAFAAGAAATQPAPQPADPLDWRLPCDVTVGHGTIGKGVPLRTLVARMKVLYEMATGNNADEVANRTPEQKTALTDIFRAQIATATAAPAVAVPSDWDVRGRLAASLHCWHRLTGAEADELAALAQTWEAPQPSPTAGMNISQRILHVGGRNNAAGYVEFGSIQAVDALVRQVLRDLPQAPAHTEPTDAELKTLRDECRSDPRVEQQFWFVLFARAVLARWGRATPQPPAPAQEPASDSSTKLAEMLLSDCGHSSNNTRLLERVATRIDKHVERALEVVKTAPAAQGDALDAEEAMLLEKAVNDFEECGETDVPDSALRRFAALGYLECVHYHVMPSAQAAIDAAIAAQKGGE